MFLTSESLNEERRKRHFGNRQVTDSVAKIGFRYSVAITLWKLFQWRKFFFFQLNIFVMPLKFTKGIRKKIRDDILHLFTVHIKTS